MTRPWVILLAGVSGLFVIGVLVKQSRPPNPDSAPARVAMLPNKGIPANEPSGWIAKPAVGARGGNGTSGAPSGQGAGTSGNVPGGGRNAFPSENRGGGLSSEPGSAAVLTGGRRPGARVSLSGSSGSAASGDIQVAGSVPAVPLPLGSTGPVSGGAQPEQVARESRNQLPADAKTNQSSDAANQDEGPVLALSFDNTTQPEKGDTAPVVEQGVTFNGQGAQFAADSQFVIPDGGTLAGESGTISFCLQPGWGGEDVNTGASLVSLRTPNMWENRLQIAKNGTYLRLLMADNTGQEANASTNINSWQSGQPHLVTATWGDALASLYVDGQLVGQQTYPGQLQLPADTPLYIGSDYPGGIVGAQGSLSNFQVYNRTLPADQVTGLTSGCGP